MSTFDLSASLLREHIEQLSLSADSLQAFSDAAAPIIAAAIMAEHKVYSIGAGIDASTANGFCHLIRDGLGTERPNLPIVQLTAEIADPLESGLNWIAKEIKALGQPGDVAVVWGSQLSSSGIDTLNSALLQRQVKPCWIGGNAPGVSMDFTEAAAKTRLSLSLASAIVLATTVEAIVFGH